MKVRWIQSPSCLHLVPIGFGFGINFVHITNFFIATDVLLRGGTKTRDDVVCYLGMEHSPGPTVDC
jgi:hypothetical protein